MNDCRYPVRYRISSRNEETHDTVTLTLEPLARLESGRLGNCGPPDFC